MKNLAFLSGVVALVLALVAGVWGLTMGLGVWPLVPAVALAPGVVRLRSGLDLVVVLLVRLGALATVVGAAVYSSQIGWVMVPAAVFALLSALATSLIVRGGRPVADAPE